VFTLWFTLFRQPTPTKVIGGLPLFWGGHALLLFVGMWGAYISRLFVGWEAITLDLLRITAICGDNNRHPLITLDMFSIIIGSTDSIIAITLITGIITCYILITILTLIHIV
jgi:hypothetical protein